MHRSFISFLTVLFVLSVFHTANGDPSIPEGRARFEVFGMFSEYVAHFTDGHTIERFYPSEDRLAEHFDSILQEFCKEEGIEPTFKKDVSPAGVITFVSPTVAAKIDRYYTNGILNKSVFSDASKGDLLRYVVGAYLRDGDKKGVAILGQANGPNKMTNVGHALQRLGCSHVRLYHFDSIPVGYTLVFSPSALVKYRLSLRAEAKPLQAGDFGIPVPL